MAAPDERTNLLPGTSAGPLEEAPLPPKPSGVDPRDLTPSTRAGILAGIWIATFLAALNTTLVATLITSISSEFNKANEAAWLGTAYLLAHAAVTPVYGRLSNVMGRRGANQLALVSLFLGTIGCGTAKSMEWLIIARFVAGCGGGGLFTTASIITSDLYDMRTRSLTQGIANLFSGAGMGFGGPLGGFVNDRWGWRMAFLIQLPLFVVSYFFTQANLRYITHGKARSRRDILARIDYLGSLALLVTVGCILFGLSFKFNRDRPWSEPSVWGSFLGAAVGAVAFVFIELFVAVEPVLAPQLLRMRVPLLVAISSLLVPLCNFAVIYFFPLWFEIVAGKSSAEAGLHLLPNSVSMSFGSLFAGWYMHKTGRYKTLNLVFGILPFIAALLIVRLSPKSGVITQWLSIIPLGFGNAVVLQTTFIALLVSIDPSQLAIGTGFVQLFRGIGQVLGVAVASAIFQSLLEKELRVRIVGPGAEELIRNIRHNSRVVDQLEPEVQKTVRQAFGVSLRRVFVCGAVCMALAFLVRLGIPEKSLDDEESDSEGEGDFAPPSGEVTPRSSFPILTSPTLIGPSAASKASTPSEGAAHLTSFSYSSTQSSASRRVGRIRPQRRLSTYESDDGVDPEPTEEELYVGSARSWRSSGSGFGGRKKAVSRQASVAQLDRAEEGDEDV